MKSTKNICTRKNKLAGFYYMDKKIKKVKEQNDKKMDKLVAEDKIRDKKMEKCGKMMKKK